MRQHHHLHTVPIQLYLVSGSDKKHTPHVCISSLSACSFCDFDTHTYLEHLEEGRLSGVAASGSGGHHNVDGGEGAHAGRGGHAVLLDDVADVAELAVGEDEAHVSHDLGEKLRKRARGRRRRRRREERG